MPRDVVHRYLLIANSLVNQIVEALLWRNGPKATAFVCTCCCFASWGYLVEPERDSWDTLSKWGCSPPEEIWEGNYISLLSSVFVHCSWWHMVFNISCLAFLGVMVERVLGTSKWALFFCSAAVVSSSAELAFPGQIGIGSSGVVFAFFGFCWFARKQYPVLRKAASDGMLVFCFLWLITSWLLNHFNIGETSDVAHLAGLVFGLLVARAFVAQPKRRLIGVTAATISAFLAICPVFWAPWSAEWVAVQASRAYSSGRFERAAKLYLRTLEMGCHPEYVWYNLSLVYGISNDGAKYNDALSMLATFSPPDAQRAKQQVADWFNKVGNAN